MTQGDQATALDYVEALGAARKAKRAISVFLIIVVLCEMGIFFAMHFGTPAAMVMGPSDLADFLRVMTGIFEMAGVIGPILLAADLALILNILLLGRLIGVSRIVSAFFWCVLLWAMCFPWQSFLANYTFPVPGVLFTWAELQARARWTHGNVGGAEEFLRWSRFVVYPIGAIMVLTMVQLKSTRGLKMAQGEIKRERPNA